MDSERIFTLDDFKDISLLTLGKPNPLPGGGSYYSKLLYNNRPIDIQVHPCFTKQGVVNTGTKSYCDLMYDNKEPLEPSLIQILEQVEERCIQLIFEKRETWFSTPLELSDIETAFTSCMRLFKSGKYTLVRTNIPQLKKTIKTNNQTCEVYNQKGDNLSLDAITNEVKIIPLIRIDELRFTSKSFHINIILNQCLILDKVDETAKKGCKIKIDNLEQTTIVSLQDNHKDKNNNNNEELLLIESNKKEELSKINNLNDIKKEKKLISSNIQTSNNNENKNIKLNKELSDVSMITNKQNNSNSSLLSLELQEVDIVPESDEEDSESNSSDLEQMNDGELQEEEIVVDDDEEDEEEEEFDGMKIIKDIKVNDKEATTLKLKKPDEVYYELYKRAKEKAKQARKEAISLFLEAKSIKAKYMLDEIDESDDEEFYSDI